ncbi:hypothetical protein J27TS8_27060 [Robertmurraya siralis]|uniref:Uncharacterized protein n=1 Tax=Robertmurraya siralis TaxID=77777 RepID=A0A919WIM2_9BACI|nr:hypothetical protein [Robertmurraya siralis]PAE20988.1 hypothetical protein CHH80_08675 [Bacillus sp. 7504-2]GIN62713.1 hypothetical protein J27TS8_27060 [Robertmurraya siralis]
MIKTAFSFAGGFVLVFLEAYIVLVFKGYHSIEFGGMRPFLNVWIMNFFLLFSIFTHIEMWRNEQGKTQRTTR